MPTNPLTKLPKSLRTTLYALLLAGGVVLGLLKVIGIEELGSLSIATLLQVWAYLGIPTGATALSHLKDDYQPMPDGPQDQ
jgi:hypothetical protein